MSHFYIVRSQSRIPLNYCAWCVDVEANNFKPKSRIVDHKPTIQLLNRRTMINEMGSFHKEHGGKTFCSSGDDVSKKDEPLLSCVQLAQFRYSKIYVQNSLKREH